MVKDDRWKGQNGKKRKKPTKKDLVRSFSNYFWSFEKAVLIIFLFRRKRLKNGRNRRSWQRRLGCVHERECDLECA